MTLENYLSTDAEYYVICDTCDNESRRSFSKLGAAANAKHERFSIVNGAVLCYECKHHDCDTRPCEDCESAAIDKIMDSEKLSPADLAFEGVRKEAV